MRILRENIKRSYGLPGFEDESKKFQKRQNKDSTKQNRITIDLRESCIESKAMRQNDSVCLAKALGSIPSPEKKSKVRGNWIIMRSLKNKERCKYAL